MTDFEIIKQELLDICEMREDIYSEFINNLDVSVLKELIKYIFSKEGSTFPKNLQFSSVNEGSLNGVVSGVSNVTMLLFEIISLCRVSATDKLFNNIRKNLFNTDVSNDSAIKPYIKCDSSGGLIQLLEGNEGLAIVLQQILLILFPGVSTKSSWTIIPLINRAELMGYIFLDNDLAKIVENKSLQYALSDFQLYEEQALDKVSARFIKQLKYYGFCNENSFPLVFLYSTRKNSFYLSGLSENIHSIKPINTKLELDNFRLTLQKKYLKKQHEEVPVIFHKRDLFCSNIEIFNRFSGQLNVIQEYMFQEHYREALAYNIEHSLAFSLIPNLNICLSYIASFLWNFNEPTNPVIERCFGYLHKNDTLGYLLVDILKQDRDISISNNYKKELQQYWRAENNIVQLDEIDSNLSNIFVDKVFADPVDKSMQANYRLRIALRAEFNDMYSEPSIIEIFFNTTEPKFDCYADEIAQFISKALILGKKVKQEIELEVQEAGEKVKINIALGIKHEIGKLIENAAKCLERQKYAQLKGALTIMRSRIKSIDKEGKIDIGDAATGEINLKQFFEDFIDPTTKPRKESFSARPSQVEVVFVDEENWKVSISESAFYAVWNNFWRNAFDVLTVFSWPETNRVDSKERLYQRVIDCEKKWGTFESRHKELPKPKLLILFRIVDGGQSISFEMIDNAPELAGGAIEYMSSQDNITHFGTNVLMNIKNRLVDKGIYCGYEPAHALSPEEVTDIYQSVPDQQILDNLALKSLMWSCVRFVIERKGHDV